MKPNPLRTLWSAGGCEVARWELEPGRSLAVADLRGGVACVLGLGGCCLDGTDDEARVIDIATCVLSGGSAATDVTACEAGARGLVIRAGQSGAIGEGDRAGRTQLTSARTHLCAVMIDELFERGRTPSDEQLEGACDMLVRECSGEVRTAVSVEAESKGPGYQPQLTCVRRAMARSCDRSKSLASFAREVGWSTWYLSRRFSAEVGLPVHRYLMRVRLRRAIHPILAGERSLAELADELGFSSHSHFTSAFRLEFGFTPMGLRKLLEDPSALSTIWRGGSDRGVDDRRLDEDAVASGSAPSRM